MTLLASSASATSSLPAFLSICTVFLNNSSSPITWLKDFSKFYIISLDRSDA
jgi:hypothetical protein